MSLFGFPGLDASSKSQSTSSQEDNRIAADSSFVAQLQGDVKGDVIFSDLGAIALGERALELSGNTIQAGFETQSNALREAFAASKGELAGTIDGVVKVAVPVVIVALIIWGLKK